MRKFTIIIFFVLYILHFTFYIPAALAADSTGSASLTTGPSADIKSKLEELKKEIASKAAIIKKEISQKLQNKAYVGSVKTKTGTTLEVTTIAGSRIVNINQDTLFESEKKLKTKFGFKSLKEQDDIAALGDVDETQILTAKKIVLLNSILSEKKHYWGQINSTSGRQLTLKDKESKNFSVVVSFKADIFEGKDEKQLQDLDTNDFVILTGVLNDEGIVVSGYIYIIPQGGVLKPKKLATPSAQISTPSSKKR